MIEIYHTQTGKPAPFVSFPFACGEPSENDCPIEWLSLDEYVSSGKSGATLYARVGGESMFDVGIEEGDIVIVDRLKRPENGMVVLARLGTTYTIKKFSEIETYNKRRKFYLVPANADFEKRPIQPKDDFEIIGVITYSVKKHS